MLLTLEYYLGFLLEWLFGELEFILDGSLWLWRHWGALAVGFGNDMLVIQVLALGHGWWHVIFTAMEFLVRRSRYCCDNLVHHSKEMKLYRNKIHWLVVVDGSCCLSYDECYRLIHLCWSLHKFYKHKYMDQLLDMDMKEITFSKYFNRNNNNNIMVDKSAAIKYQNL